jgi:hypothetical protein
VGADEQDAVEKAAEQFKVPATKLMQRAAANTWHLSRPVQLGWQSKPPLGVTCFHLE